jgi:hypothetical protein
MLRLPLLLVLYAAPVACFQSLESGAADDTQPRFDAAPPPTTAIKTPSIELDFTEGRRITTDPCVSIREQAREVLTVNCASCHGGGAAAMQGQPPFDCVLDVEKLKNRVSETVKDPRDPSKGMRFLVPGDPDDSRLYARVQHDEMPPKLPFGLRELPRPTISDISVLREWIQSCIGAPPPAPAARSIR